MNSFTNRVLNMLRDPALWEEPAYDCPVTLGLLADRQFMSAIEEPEARESFTDEEIAHAAPVLDRLRALP